MHCPRCHTQLPDDARFCIECGSAVRVATGETIQLPTTGATTITCPHCQFTNPGHARFCLYCGESLHTSAGQPAGGNARSAPPAQPQPVTGDNELGITLILIGGALLLSMILRLPLPVWPNLLMILGIAQLIIYIRRGAPGPGLRNAIWLFGLGILFLVPRLFFPGMLLLVGLTLLIESWRWTRHHP